MITPKCTRLIPRDAATGARIGARMMTDAPPSMNIPIMRSSTLTSNKNAYLLLVSDRIRSFTSTGIFRAVRP